MSKTITTLEIPGIKKVASGKVREIFDLGDHYLFVASDRISAFDCIIPTGIPNKGRVLTQLSRHWFGLLGNIVPNHLIHADLDRLPPELTPYRESLDGRFMVVEKLEMFPVECVVRGYLVGSGYKEYKKQGTVCGLPLPEGLPLAAKLETPIFTPSTKAEDGHDENISFERMAEIVGQKTADDLRDLSIRIYQEAANYAAKRGVLIADTKFEFGLRGDTIVLGDEVLTPDSSRYWPASDYQTGANPPSFDKQYVRDYLQTQNWDKTPPAPELPDQVVKGTTDRYLDCYQILTGNSLI